MENVQTISVVLNIFSYYLSLASNFYVHLTTARTTPALLTVRTHRAGLPHASHTGKLGEFTDG